MFETVVPETITRKSRKVFYETLPVSLALHAVIGAGVLLGASWDVAFPLYTPRLTRPYSLVTIPDPPPPPPPPQAQPVAPKTNTPPPPQVRIAEMAPTVIPDLVPRVNEIPLPAELPPPPVVAAPEPAPSTPA